MLERVVAMMLTLIALARSDGEERKPEKVFGATVSP
jgi:hypothetical protein